MVIQVRVQFLTKYGLLIVFLAGVLTCRKQVIISNRTPGLSIQGGKILYKGIPFTGILKSEIPALKEVQFMEYKNGFEDGESIKKTDSGQLLERRSFKNGMKQGIHQGWYRNGSRKFYSEFKDGRYMNARWEWHENGKLFKFEKYNENGKILVSKTWRSTGQIYMNLVFTNDGSAVGLPGSKLCDPIKEENRTKR